MAHHPNESRSFVPLSSNQLHLTTIYHDHMCRATGGGNQYFGGGSAPWQIRWLSIYTGYDCIPNILVVETSFKKVTIYIWNGASFYLGYSTKSLKMPKFNDCSSINSKHVKTEYEGWLILPFHWSLGMFFFEFSVRLTSGLGNLFVAVAQLLISWGCPSIN